MSEEQKHTPELLAALQGLVELYSRPGESRNDAFERRAKQFFEDTGVTALGKDCAYERETHDERMKIYHDWINARVDRARAAISSATGQDGGGQ